MKAKRRRRLRQRERRARKVRRLAALAKFGTYNSTKLRNVMSPERFARMFMGVMPDSPSEEIQEARGFHIQAAVGFHKSLESAAVIVSGRRRYISFRDFEQRRVEEDAVKKQSAFFQGYKSTLQLLDEWKK